MTWEHRWKLLIRTEVRQHPEVLVPSRPSRARVQVRSSKTWTHLSWQSIHAIDTRTKIVSITWSQTLPICTSLISTCGASVKKGWNGSVVKVSSHFKHPQHRHLTLVFTSWVVVQVQAPHWPIASWLMPICSYMSEIRWRLQGLVLHLHS